MTVICRRTVFAAACAMAFAACAGAGTGDITADQVALAPLPTVGGVGVLPSTVPPEREAVGPGHPARAGGRHRRGVGRRKVIDNRLLVIGDSIMASTATRYSGLMCDKLVPLGWAVEVEAEPSRFIDFGNRVLDKVLDPVVGTPDDWDAAVVHLGSNYGRDQQRFEDELRIILYRLAPRPTLLYTVTEYRPAWAEVNETIRKLAGEFPNVDVVDWEQTARYPGVLSGDGLHPTNTGREVLVDLTASAFGPAALGAGECLKSQFTDDSAVGRGSNTPASKPPVGRATVDRPRRVEHRWGDRDHGRPPADRRRCDDGARRTAGRRTTPVPAPTDDAGTAPTTAPATTATAAPTTAPPHDRGPGAHDRQRPRRHDGSAGACCAAGWRWDGPERLSVERGLRVTQARLTFSGTP